jgi:hypothetical protein
MGWLMPPPPLPEMTGAQDNKFQSDREAVYTLLRELADATLRRNLSFFERTLTDDYVGVHNNSLKSFNKTQQIAAIQSHGLSAEKYEFRELNIGL